MFISGKTVSNTCIHMFSILTATELYCTQSPRAFPYCQHHFLVNLISSTLSGQNQARGTFKITLNGDRTSSLPLELDNADLTFKPGSIESTLIESTKYIGENINQITVSYTKTTNIISSFL